MSHSSQSSRVLRVTGLPSDKGELDLIALLRQTIHDRLSRDERQTLGIRIECLPSCDAKTLTALVEIAGTFPRFLSAIENDPLTDWQEVMDDDDINFDQHFFGFTQLYSTPADQPVTADIIAITGLDGHAYGSWRGRGNLGRMWLRDFLRKDLPNCRTMIYGYNSKLSRPGVDKIWDYSREFLQELRKVRSTHQLQERPLIFIAHSFGGLLLAHSLVRAKQTDDRNHAAVMTLHRATYAILFFGTPHQGLLTEDVLRALGDEHPRRELVQQLQPESDVLTQLLMDFKDLCIDYRIVSFYETHQMRSLELDNITQRWRRTGRLNMTVRPYSALLGLPDQMEIKVKVDADHSNIVKFDHRSQKTYQTALLHLKLFQQNAGEVVAARFRQGANANDYHVSFSLRGVPVSTKFVDRPQMQQLEEELLPRAPLFRRKVFVLYGMGGMGKTQLAVEFARRHQQRFHAIFWLDGRSEETLKQSIANHAARVPEGQITDTSRTYASTQEGKLDDVVRDFLQWLSKPDNTCWLLILDNADRDANDLGGYDPRKYFGDADHGFILITTRLASLRALSTSSTKVQAVDTSTAHAIFRTWVTFSYNSSDVDELFLLLGGLPLAIAQAGAYLQEDNASDISKYTSFYKEQWHRLQKLQDSNHPLPEYENGSILTTWTISFEAIRKRNETAANLLLLWAWLNNRDLWYGLLSTAITKRRQEFESTWIERISTDELAFEEAMKLLQRYSLVERMHNLDGYATHPVVHKWASYMKIDSCAVDLEKTAAIIVGLAVPHHSVSDAAKIQRRLLPHAEVCRERISRWPASTPAEYAGFTQAETVPAIIDSVHNLGILYRDQGMLREAESMYKQSLQNSEEALGPDHSTTLDIVNNFGLLYRDQGKLDEAEKMHLRALKGKEEIFGPEHTSTLDIVDNLGNLYTDQGKLKEAEAMYQRSLQGSDKTLGPDHPSTLYTMNNLGLLYAYQGMFKEAESMYQRSLRGSEKALGPNHTLTLTTVDNLGGLYTDQGKLDEGEVMYQRALEGRRKILGANHISTLDTLNNLANLYADQGKVEAEAMYLQALQGKEKVLGHRHTSTLYTINNLGLLYRDQGKLEEAEKWCRMAKEGLSSVLGPDHAYVMDSVQGLGQIYKDRGNLEGAEQMFQEALRGYMKTYGADCYKRHPPTQATVKALVDIYRTQDRLREADGMEHLLEQVE